MNRLKAVIKYSVILPVYNDANALFSFAPQLFEYLAGQGGQSEIIIVDDGSNDNLADVYRELLKIKPDAIVLLKVKLSRNFGKEAALSAGMNYCQGEVIAFMDSDGQHSIQTLDQMLGLLDNQKIDAVTAVQEDRKHEGIFLRFFKKLFYTLIQDSQRYQIKANAGDFRVMRRKVVNALLQLPERQRFMKGLYAWVGFNTVYIAYSAEKRYSGKSKFNFANLFELATIGITSFSQKPLRLISRSGILISIMALCYGLFIFIDTLFFGKDLAGWPTLAVSIMLFSGVQLISLGIIGEYIGRIYEEVKQRPVYLVDHIERSDDCDQQA